MSGKWFIANYLLFSTSILFVMYSEPVLATPQNTLSEEEKEKGFELLFNGKNLDGWEGEDDFCRIEDGPWKVKDGSLYYKSGYNGFFNLCAKKRIAADYDLRFEWKGLPSHQSPNNFQGHFLIGTNGAMTENGWKGRLYCGYHGGDKIFQLSTDETSIPKLFIAGTASSENPIADARIPVGLWNEARMVCKGSVVQHWLNGVKIIDIDLRDKKWQEKQLDSLIPVLEAWFKVRKKGLHLSIGNSSDPGWYRNIKVREIPKKEKFPVEAEGNAVQDPKKKNEKSVGLIPKSSSGVLVHRDLETPAKDGQTTHDGGEVE